MNNKYNSLLLVALLFIPTSAMAVTITFIGNVYSVGSSIAGDAVHMGDTVYGRFVYTHATDDTNPDINYGDYNIVDFDIVFSSGFSSSSTNTTAIIQNDQLNGPATLAADGMRILATGPTGGALNGRQLTGYQFGLRRENVNGQLWLDDALPSFYDDWPNISLADINTPDWHWMQFVQLGDRSIFDSQIRWDVTNFITSAPEPPTLALLCLGFVVLCVSKWRSLKYRLS